MKVLQLCHKPPYPVIDGGCIAISTISNGLLNNGVDLKILTASTEKHPFLINLIPGDFAKHTRIEGIFLDTRINIIDAFSALVTADSYNVSRFFSPDFNKRVSEILQEEEYDIVHLESLFMTPYIDTIRKNSSAKIVLRSHNLEHLIWERLANSTANKAKRIYLKHLANKLKDYEYRTIHDVDGIAAISFEDTKRYKEMGSDTPLVTIPFGVDLNKYALPEPKKAKLNQLFHIGAMNWSPNEEAINWLLDEIWPDLSKLDLKLHLAGRAMPNYIHRLNSNQLVVHGEVPDAIEFMSNYDIMVVPLLSGSGMRIKIIEGMALGKTVVSTSVGAEGINYKNGENIVICDDPAEFQKNVKDLIENPEKTKKIGENARRLVEEQYNNNEVILTLINFCKHL